MKEAKSCAGKAMSEVFKTDGIVTDEGSIHTANLPFEKGQKVELVVWSKSEPDELSTPEEISRRLAGLEELDRWFKANRPKDLPRLSDEAISRESIYEDRGL
jgi:hypothetical protein